MRKKTLGQIYSQSKNTHQILVNEIFLLLLNYFLFNVSSKIIQKIKKRKKGQMYSVISLTEMNPTELI